MKYFANTDHHEYQFTLEENATGYEVKDTENNLKDVEIRVLDEHRYSLLINKQSYIIKSEHKGDHYSITIRGKKFEIEVNTEKSKMWKEIISAAASEGNQGTIKAPMPGLLVKYLVNEGDTVEKGQSIYILSAMKMENEIKSDFTGTITKLSIDEGTAVEKGQEILLVE